jgi:plastocyanin
VSTLDSRALTYVNTFGRRFGEAGRVRYRLVSGAVGCQPAREDLPFAIEVAEGNGGEQHDVTVRLEGDRLVADPPQLKTVAGDVVLWHSPSASAPAYVVQGESPSGTFDSSSLTSDSLYTHAFGTAGEFEWTDAIGRSVSGVVKVGTLESDDRNQCREWMEALERGTLVVIERDRAEPREVSILAGQTVFFAVTASEGVTVTDVSSLPG